MKTPARFLRGFVVLAIAGLGLVVACSNQGEGDRCELDNGDSDCDTGANLICVPGPTRESSETGSWRASYAQGVNDPYKNADRCCPLNRDLATHPACVRQSAATDAAPPTDSGPTATDAAPTTDAASTVDAATVSDAAQDAPDAD
jgi:hypothetical protein